MVNKGKLDKEEQVVETMSEFITRTIDEAIIDNIPLEAIKELPLYYKYVLGIFAELLMAGMFAYFMYSVYVQGRSSAFISLDINSGDCQVIKKSITGQYIADTNGVWNGYEGFDYTRGLYVIGFTEASITQTEYEDILYAVHDQVSALSDRAMLHDLTYNLLIYMSWQFICDPLLYDYCLPFVGQSFAFSASSQYVFSLSYVDSTLSNNIGDCMTTSLSHYDLANSINVGTYIYDDFLNDPTCNTTVDPVHMGYDSVLNGDTFAMTLDSRTLIDSMSVNLDLLLFSSLSIVGESHTYHFENHGYNYTGNYYTDAWYVGMRPLFCLDNPGYQMDDDELEGGINNICFISIGDVTGLPIFLHFGAGNFNDYGPMANSPMNCECDEFGHDNQCDVFNLMSGFMFFDGLSLAESVDIWLNLTIAAGDSYRLNQQAYNASWASAASTYSPEVDPVINDPDWRNAAYEFCRTEAYGYCSIMIFNSYGDSVFDKSLSPSLFLVNNGSCAPQFTIPETSYANLIQSAPTPIVESYYQCVLTWSDALTNAAGIAGGNVSIIVPIILFMALPVIYLWLKFTGNVTPIPEYDKSQKELALDLLALQILRVRDNRTRGMKRNGYLMKLAEELVGAARYADGGAWDSDDSDDEPEVDSIDNPLNSGRNGIKRKASRKFAAKSENIEKADPKLSTRQRAFLPKRRFQMDPDSDDEDFDVNCVSNNDDNSMRFSKGGPILELRNMGAVNL